MMLSYASYTLQQINSLHQVQMIGVFSKRNVWTLLRREEMKKPEEIQPSILRQLKNRNIKNHDKEIDLEENVSKQKGVQCKK